MLHNPLSDMTAPDCDRVAIYWCGRIVRRNFLSLLDGLAMTAKAKGEPFEFKERKGFFESSFSIRATPDRHAAIRRWAKQNATWQ